MSQEPLEAVPSRRALRAREADAGQATAEPSAVPALADELAPRPSRRELRAQAQAPASLWSEPAEQWAGHGEQWVEQTGSWAVQEPAADLGHDAGTDLGSEHWAAPEPARAEQWADQADQWSVPEPAPADRWQDLEPVDDVPLESGSLIMPAGHASTGPVTPAQPYGRPAVFLDAPVQPALRPLDGYEAEADPVRARIDLAEPAVVPSPRIARRPDAPEPAPARGGADEVALRALALAEALSSAETAVASRTSAREEELADPLGELTLAERLASLPVAPWAVDLELLEGGYVEHPCEPVDSVPHPHEPVAETVPPVAPAPTRAPEPMREVPATRAVAPAPVARPDVPGVVARPDRVPAPEPDGSWAGSSGPDPLAALRREAGPQLATWGAWLGVAATVAWFLGPFALGIGVWAIGVARRFDYSRARPITAMVGGAVGTLMGAVFLFVWH